MQTYDSYKNSGIEWLGEIPSHWEIKPGFTVLKERKERNKGMLSNNVLSLSYGKIIEKPIEKLTGLVPENFETYQLVYEGDIIFRPTDLQNDKVSLRTGLSNFDGIITSAYINLQPINSIPKFIHYYLHTTDTNKVIYGLGSGLRQNISFLDFKRFLFAIPPISEQEAIAAFLDEKCGKIDELVSVKEQQIALLKERRQVVIHEAVTKGIQPNVEIPTLSGVEKKHSGIDWIGEIPSHWEVKRLKYGLELINEKVNSKETGLNYFGMENIESWTGRYIETTSEVEGIASTFYKGNILFGKLRPYLAKVHLAEVDGICSSEFLVFNTSKMNEKYSRNLLVSPEFIKAVNASTYGAKMPRASVDFVKNMIIPIPPISEQEAIVAYLEEQTGKIDQAIALKTQQIEKLKAYKQSLINEVVTGKVKVA